MASRFHPWRQLRGGPVDVSWVRMPDDVHGRTDGEHIWLDKRLLQVERRCTLTHEMVHVKLGHTTCQPANSEARVRRITAEKLITTSQLTTAASWARSHAEMADELWVTPDVLADRLTMMSPAERALVVEALRARDVID